MTNVFIEEKKNVRYSEKCIIRSPYSESIQEETLASPEWIPVDKAV